MLSAHASAGLRGGEGGKKLARSWEGSVSPRPFEGGRGSGGGGGGDGCSSHPSSRQQERSPTAPTWSIVASLGGETYSLPVLGTNDQNADLKYSFSVCPQENAHSHEESERSATGVGRSKTSSDGKKPSSCAKQKFNFDLNPSANTRTRQPQPSSVKTRLNEESTSSDPVGLKVSSGASVCTIETSCLTPLSEAFTDNSPSVLSLGGLRTPVLPCVPDLDQSPRSTSVSIQQNQIEAEEDEYEYKDQDEQDCGVAKITSCLFVPSRKTSRLHSSIRSSITFSLNDYIDNYDYTLSTRAVHELVQQENTVPLVIGGGDRGSFAVLPSDVHVSRQVVDHQIKAAISSLLYKLGKWHRRRVANRKIESSLRVLRGAGVYYNEEEVEKELYADVIHKEELQHLHSACCLEENEETCAPALVDKFREDGLELSCRPQIRSMLSGVGVALFSPLDGVFPQEHKSPSPWMWLGSAEAVPQLLEEELCSSDEEEEVEAARTKVTCHLPGQLIQEKTPTPEADLASTSDESEPESDSESEEPECLFQLCIVPEPLPVLKANPRILPESAMQTILDYGLPVSIKMRRWVRAYSLLRDGDSFEMMLRSVQQHRYTLLAVRTTHGEMFGGFADSFWERQGGLVSRLFYGTGQGFLFKVNEPHSMKNGSRAPLVDIYRWTGDNNYCQMCDVDNGVIGMGGGGEDGCFGLCIQEYFSRGSTGRCATFGNEPLCEEKEFQISDVEIYGFWC